MLHVLKIEQFKDGWPYMVFSLEAMAGNWVKPGPGLTGSDPVGARFGPNILTST